jgi:hypothetical protein
LINNENNEKERGESMRNQVTVESKEKRIAENLWLNYFNRYLFENNTISEKEYKLMTEKIALRDARCYGVA